MLMLSFDGWVDGISATLVLFISAILGIYMITQSIKTNARLLKYCGYLFITGGLMFLGVFYDFIVVLSTGDNANNIHGIVGLLSYVWPPITLLLSMYVVTELVNTKYKFLLMIIYFLLTISLYVILFIDPWGSLIFINPESPGDSLIDFQSNFLSLAGILLLIMALSYLIFIGTGLLFKSFSSEGILRKKIRTFAIGQYLLNIFSMIEGWTTPGMTIILIRAGLLFSFWLLYLALREEPEKPVKIPLEKEIKVEGDLFRITKRPDIITEEEVSFHKEKKICLVCKGNAVKFTYICPECDALYCQNCAQALIEIENVCWVCDSQIDDSKPFTPYKKEMKESKPIIKEDNLSEKLKK